jgi:hypothetical protein
VYERLAVYEVALRSYINFINMLMSARNREQVVHVTDHSKMAADKFVEMIQRIIFLLAVFIVTVYT